MSSKILAIQGPHFLRVRSRQLVLLWIDTDRRHGIGLPCCGHLKDATRPVLRPSVSAPYRWRKRSNSPFMRGNLGTDALCYSHRDMPGAPTCIADVQILCLAVIVVALATCPAGTLAPRGLAIDATFLDRHVLTVYGRPRSPQSSASRAGPPYASGAYLKCEDQ